jgi:hypothetical protein
MKTNTPRKIEKLDPNEFYSHVGIVNQQNEMIDAINYILNWIQKQEEDGKGWLPENTGGMDTSEIEDEDDL